MGELVKDSLTIDSAKENPFYIDCTDEGIWFLRRGKEKYFGTHIKVDIINLAERLNKAHKPNVVQGNPLTILVCWNDHEKYEDCNYIEEISPAKEGLFYKYIISKPFGNWVDPMAEYFVLRLDNKCKDKVHLAACRAAILTYVEEIQDYKPKLCQDILDKYLIY